MYTYTYIQVRSLGWEDHLEKAMATHSSILNRRISETEKLVGYSPWDHRVGHNWAANTKSPLWWSILFFIAYSVFFSFGISFCIFFFKISVSLFNLSSCSCIIFLILLSHLCYPIAHRSSLKQSIAFFLRQLVDLHFFEVSYCKAFSFLWWCHVSLTLHVHWSLASLFLWLKKQSCPPVFTNWL